MHTKLLLAFTLATFFAGPATAQDPALPVLEDVEAGSTSSGWPVPTIDHAASVPAAANPAAVTLPPPVNYFAGRDTALTSREQASLALSNEWIDGPGDFTGRGEAGTIMFRFGAALPSVVCSPLTVCDIELQAGEIVNNVQVGDPVRWSVTPAVSGGGPRAVTHVVVKPSDIGLQTNLLITTDRRTYRIKLVSRRDEYMPAVAFSYPDEEAAAWEAYRAATARPLSPAAAPIGAVATGQSGELDFGFELGGDSPSWRPLRVYTDGQQTFIQFPPAMSHDEAPVLVVLGDDKREQLVNYRMAGDRMVVDKVIARALLVSGVGRKQTRVRITRTGGR